MKMRDNSARSATPTFRYARQSKTPTVEALIPMEWAISLVDAPCDANRTASYSRVVKALRPVEGFARVRMRRNRQYTSEPTQTASTVNQPRARRGGGGTSSPIRRTASSPEKCSSRRVARLNPGASRWSMSPPVPVGQGRSDQPADCCAGLPSRAEPTALRQGQASIRAPSPERPPKWIRGVTAALEALDGPDGVQGARSIYAPMNQGRRAWPTTTSGSRTSMRASAQTVTWTM